MSIKSGDRARACKQRTKRRLRRIEIRHLRKVLSPSENKTPAIEQAPEAKA